MKSAVAGIAVLLVISFALYAAGSDFSSRVKVVASFAIMLVALALVYIADRGVYNIMEALALYLKRQADRGKRRHAAHHARLQEEWSREEF